MDIESLKSTILHWHLENTPLRVRVKRSAEAAVKEFSGTLSFSGRGVEFMPARSELGDAFAVRISDIVCFGDIDLGASEQTTVEGVPAEMLPLAKAIASCVTWTWIGLEDGDYIMICETSAHDRMAGFRASLLDYIAGKPQTVN